MTGLPVNGRSQANLPPHGHVARLPGLDLYHEECGQAEAPPLLLLHGYFKSGTMWRERGLLCADRWRVIISDIRGHGRTANPADELKGEFLRGAWTGEPA